MSDRSGQPIDLGWQMRQWFEDLEKGLKVVNKSGRFSRDSNDPDAPYVLDSRGLDVGGVFWDPVDGPLGRWGQVFSAKVKGLDSPDTQPTCEDERNGKKPRTRRRKKGGRKLQALLTSGDVDPELEDKDFPDEPDWFPKFPGDWTGHLGAGTDMDGQSEVWHPDFLGLVAVNAQGDPSLGTMVWDLDDHHRLDQKRKRELQSIFSVIELADGCLNGKAIALNLGKGGRLDGGLGYLTFTDWDTCEIGIGSGTHGGPLTINHDKGCQHDLGKDVDGNPVRPVHIPTKALFKRGGQDAPLEFSNLSWQDPVSPGPFTLDVWLKYKPYAAHEVCGKTYPNVWAWQTTGYISELPPPYPPPPPPPPPYPPPPFPPPPHEPPPSGETKRPLIYIYGGDEFRIGDVEPGGVRPGDVIGISGQGLPIGHVDGNVPHVGQGGYTPSYASTQQCLFTPGMGFRAGATNDGELDPSGSRVPMDELGQGIIDDLLTEDKLRNSADYRSAPQTAVFSPFAEGTGKWGEFTSVLDSSGNFYVADGGVCFHPPGMSVGDLLAANESAANSTARMVFPPTIATIDFGWPSIEYGTIDTGHRMFATSSDFGFNAVTAGGVDNFNTAVYMTDTATNVLGSTTTTLGGGGTTTTMNASGSSTAIDGSGTFEVSVGTSTFTIAQGKLTWDARFDPTTLELTAQASRVSGMSEGLWMDNGSPNLLKFYDGSSDHTLSYLTETVTGVMTTRGDLVRRGVSAPERFAIGADNTLLTSDGTDPGWETLTSLLDAALGSTAGMVAYRGASAWAATAAPGGDNYVLTWDAGGSTVGWEASAGGSSLPVADTTSIVEGSADNTKELRFEVDGFTTATTRVATWPDKDITVADNADVVLRDGTAALSADWDAGSQTITALRFVSDQATGTAPFGVSSTTVVSNLNADLLDGNEATAFVLADGTRDITGIQTITIEDAGTATVLEALRLQRTTTGTAAAGLGVALDAYLENAGGTAHQAGRIAFDWGVATAASEDSDLTVSLFNDGSLVEAFKIEGDTATITVGEWAATDVAVAHGGTGASTAAGARTNLGLVIGTDVQAQDAELSAIAVLTSAADRLPYFTGSGTASLATFTTAGRALLDDADASAQRTTLGLGTIATQAANSVSITGGSITGITDLAVADGGTGGSTATAGFDNLSPMTASGDIIYGGASGTGTRLAAGSDGEVLTLASGVPSWAAASGSSYDHTDINENFEFRSDHAIAWSDSTANTTTLDVGLDRAAAGGLQVTNGSTGGGFLRVGSNANGDSDGDLCAGTTAARFFYDQSEGRVKMIDSAGTVPLTIDAASKEYRLSSDGGIGWADTTNSRDTINTTITRSASGVLRIDDALNIGAAATATNSGDFAAGLAGARIYYSANDGDLRWIDGAGVVKLEAAGTSDYFSLASDASLFFSSTTDARGTPDLGLVRDSASFARLSDGSTGLADLSVNRIGIGFTGNPGVALGVREDVGSNTVNEVLRLQVRNTAAAGGAGLGASLNFWLENSASSAHEAGEIRSEWTDATNTSEDSDMILATYANGSLTDMLTLDGSAGYVTLNSAAGIAGEGLTNNSGVLDVDINGLTEQASPGSGDFFVIYDAGLAALRKVDYDNLPAGGGSDHGALSGLADDDHTHYALLNGRSGGQTFYGGTAASDQLTIYGTSHATPGTVVITADIASDTTHEVMRVRATRTGAAGPGFGAALGLYVDNSASSSQQGSRIDSVVTTATASSEDVDLVLNTRESGSLAEYLRCDASEGSVYLPQGELEMAEQGSSPGTPPSGRGSIYVRDDGTLRFKNDSGNETTLSSAGGGSSSTRISTNTTQAGNISGGEDDLMSYTVAAGQLASDGDELVVHGWGELGANSGTRTIKSYVDGTAMESQAVGSGGNGFSWRGSFRIIRISSTSLEIMADLNADTFATNYQRYTEAVSDLASNSFVIKFTGQDSNSNTDEVVQKAMTVDYYPAP